MEFDSGRGFTPKAAGLSSESRKASPAARHNKYAEACKNSTGLPDFAIIEI